MTLLIKHGTIVTATDEYRGDVFIDAEKISTVGSTLGPALSSTFATASRWTSSGPSARRIDLACAHADARKTSSETPAAPWAWRSSAARSTTI